jgi:NADPH-dependent glutamate synthase beta subunit-like oxidoreductase
MSEPESYAIAVIGGACAGAEAASIFAQHGILTVVFEQNDRPYGKIEDGLPKWHVALRHKEYRSIDQNLSQPHVHFVPGTKVGRDLELHEIANEWGFQAVVLANGAWRDRPLSVEGADDFVGRGLVYQNPFIYWFNHYHEQTYEGPQYEIVDGTMVVGGGLASIDVVKAIQLELVLRALRERGIEAEMVELETKGIPKILASHDLTWEDLGLKGCALFYRRRPQDMPVVSLPEGANEAQRTKIAKSRTRVLEKAISKYLFGFEEQHAPVGLIVENERLVGLRYARTEVEGGKVRLTDETVDIRAPLIISSIGSIPEPVAGIAMRGELYDFQDWDLGRLADFPTLFSAGNVVTGKGNIVHSRKHARHVAGYMTQEYLKLANAVRSMEPISAGVRESILKRTRDHQSRVGYDGNYRAWIESVTRSDEI